MQTPSTSKISVKVISVFFGLIVFSAILLLNPFHLDQNANKTTAIALLMVTWWVTEALPMPVVALLPLILFPLMGIAKIDEVAGHYSNPVIFLFLGGFLIGLAIEKWQLHRRIALNIVQLTGTGGNRIVLGFIIATGFISMWLSNTATTMMMYPIAMSVIQVVGKNDESDTKRNNLSICLMLAIAYASNFGGISTIIGTPPNVAYAAFLEKHNGYTFQFVDWMKFCIPIAIILMTTFYFVTTKWLYPVGNAADGIAKQMIGQELKLLGRLTKPEKRVLIIFCFTALLWITKDIINASQDLFKLDDTMIAVLGAVLLFIIPADRAQKLLEWGDTQKMSWGILLLFGGGISLANQLEQAGIIRHMGLWMSGFAAGGIVLVLIVAIISIFISEIMSNVAQVIVFAPVITSIAEAIGMNPLQLGMAMTLSASCASMLPMGTPPNAIVFASGKLKLRNMVVTGFIMNLIAIATITLFCWHVLPMILKPVH
jgi:sodium-dependent dicarboxylate transporter 2/3/5